MVSMSELAQRLMAQNQAYVIAPAGCGKTQTIVQMVALNDNGKQLILTHTHAGVQSLAKRLKKLKIPSNCYHLETIAGWALRLARGYPDTTKFSKPFPDDKGDWKVILEGVKQLISLSFMKKVIQASYTGIIIDEYQDCTLQQHELILNLASILPCRIFGDPLQGIFGFGKGDTLVDWSSDIKPNFTEVIHEPVPYRWEGKNIRLGHWLMDVRKKLLNNESISLEDCPINWIPSPNNEKNQALWQSIKKDGTIVVVHPQNSSSNICHKLASQLQEKFQSLEEMEARDLLKWAGKLDKSSGGKRVVLIIEFASACCTQVSTELKTIKQKFEESDKPDFSRIKNYKEIATLLTIVSQQQDFTSMIDTLNMMRKMISGFMYRADLWHSMIQALNFYKTGNYPSLYEAAWHARQRQRFMGRVEYPRIISRTLLVKGLEYDHGILLDAHQFDRKNLYVALTRASSSLTIVSNSPELNPIS